MINELYELAKSMLNIDQKRWHDALKELPKATCFRIWISDKIAIRSVEKIDKSIAKTLQKWQPNSNGMSFPAFNLPKMYNFPKKVEKDGEKLPGDILSEWIEDSGKFDFATFKQWFDLSNKPIGESSNNSKSNKVARNQWDFTAQRKLDNCLWKLPQELKAKINNRVGNALTKLIEVLEGYGFGGANSNPQLAQEKFYKTIEEYIFTSLEKGDNVKTLLEFLNDEKPSVFLDLYEHQLFRYPVAHEKTIIWINKILLENGEVEPKSYKAPCNPNNDAFGELGTHDYHKMSKVKLSHLGWVILRSMSSSDSQNCQYRYGRIESNSYPITQASRDKIKKAFEWLKNDERRGKNWTTVGQKELLFAYPSVLRSDVKIPTCLVRNADGESQTIDRYERRAEEVIDALRKLKTDGDPVNIQIFALIKMDQARTKVAYYRNYDADKLIKAADDWKIACANIPSIQFNEQTKNYSDKTNQTEMSELLRAEIPFPTEIAKVANKIWKANGTALEAKNLTPYHGLDLMLEEKSSDLALYVLRVLTINSAGLIKYLGETLHREQSLLNADSVRDGCKYLFSFFGLLLYRLKIYKGDYMENIPYLLGQMLKISDELHALYCKIVRDGSVPPQLAGSSLLSAALETPISALAQLGQRMNPYLNWAKSYRTKEKEKSGEADKYLCLYEKAADKAKYLLNQHIVFGDPEKAQLFIGYLASFQEKEGDVKPIADQTNATNTQGATK